MRTSAPMVGDVRPHALDLAPVPQIYLAHAQSADPPNYVTLTVRSTLAPAALESEVRAIAGSIDRGVPVYGTTTMAARVADSLARRTFLLELFGLFAGTALLLAALGVHGTIAHAVRRRTREFGLRRVVGASDADVLAIASARTARCFAAGLAIGLPLAFAWSTVMSAELYDIGPFDATSIVLVVLALAVVVVLSTLAPLRRALGIDPAVALRNE